jgi:predicted RNA-binding Zn-ribbon protein involved in translation (DUF1610 family)
MTTQIVVEPKELVFIQSRAETNHDLVDEYAAMMQDGVQFDAAQGVRDESGQVYIFDGLHRGAAARLAGLSLLVEIQPGTRQDAEWLALSANQKHGLRRSHQDKQRIVRNALLHPYGASLSDREIARHCGVDHKTVGKIRKELEATGEIPQLNKRMVQKADGTTYEIDTSNIGSAPARQEEEHPGESIAPARYDEVTETRQPDNGHKTEPNARYEPTAQEFECPRCGQEKIVGVNGSRRWCLACDAEWPTAQAFLAEVNARRDRQLGEGPTRTELQSRFASILARLEDEQLGEMAAWLDELERRLAEPEGQPALLFEPMVPINQLEEA